jgi:hypothetical protein
VHTLVIFTHAPHSSAHKDGCGLYLKKKKFGHPRYTGTNFPPTPWSGHASYISDSGKFPMFYATKYSLPCLQKHATGLLARSLRDMP